MIALGAAFALGVTHTLEPDHVLAVSTIVSQSRTPLNSVLAGSVWGVGHTLALLIAGLIVILLRLHVPVGMESMFDGVVGVMLVGLGLWVLLNLQKRKVHFHWHDHEGVRHIHFHSHARSEVHDHAHMPLLVGVVHGLAGSGILTVIAMSTMGSLYEASLFIACFGVGLVLGMTFISSALSLPKFMGHGSTMIGYIFSMASGSLSVILGLFMLWMFLI